MGGSICIKQPFSLSFRIKRELKALNRFESDSGRGVNA